MLTVAQRVVNGGRGEDRLLVERRGQRTLAVIANGAGGTGGGKVAAELTCSSAGHFMGTETAGTPDFWEKCLVDVDCALIKSGSGGQSTAVIAAISAPAIRSRRRASRKRWLGGLLLVLAACAQASPCDRTDRRFTETQRATLSAAVAGQLEAPSAEVLRSYRLGNWYLLYVDTHIADEAFVFFRGDPASHRYVALWSGAAAKTKQAELRTWARTNARGVPETLASCFAFTAVTRRSH